MRNSYFSFDEVLESSIDFGVPLPKKARVTLSRKLDALGEQFPVNSSLDLHFSNEGAKLRGCLKIKTLDRTFSSVYFGNHPFSIYENLEKEVMAQAADWKKVRFLGNVRFNKSMVKNSHLISGGAI